MSESQIDDLVLHSERNLARTNPRSQEACVLALVNCATTRWPRGMAGLMFPVGLRTRVTTSAARIETVADLARGLGPICELETSVLGEHADELVSIIKSVVSLTQTNSHLLLVIIKPGLVY